MGYELSPRAARSENRVVIAAPKYATRPSEAGDAEAVARAIARRCRSRYGAFEAKTHGTLQQSVDDPNLYTVLIGYQGSEFGGFSGPNDWARIFFRVHRQPEKNPRTIKLVPTVQSIFETDVYELAADPDAFGLEADEAYAYGLLAESVTMSGDRLRVPDSQADREVLWRLLVDLANAYGDAAEYGESDDPRFDRLAGNSLGTLASKVLAGG